MFAAQRIVPFVEAKAAEELGERMPNRVVVNRAASATKERALMKHDGFIARLQREDAKSIQQEEI